jgi:hypothetical protein
VPTLICRVRPKRFAKACGGEITGVQLLAAAESTREMRDSLVGVETHSRGV